MKRQTKILIAFLFLVLGVYFAYNYMYQEHRDIKTEEAKVNVSAGELVQLFKDTDSPEVLNSTVQISGIITELDTHSLTLDNSVQCSFDTAIKGVSIDEKTISKFW